MEVRRLPIDDNDVETLNAGESIDADIDFKLGYSLTAGKHTIQPNFVIYIMEMIEAQ
jgi:hypothetical protein